MPRAARAFALASFAFSIQTALSNARSRLQKQIENCEAASDGKHFVARAEEKLTVLVELESAIRASSGY